ncbi:ATP-binding protein [Leptolyngbya sp. FACHB-1515]
MPFPLASAPQVEQHGKQHTVAMVLHSASGGILACNAAAEQILGVTLQQMLCPAQPPWQIINLQGDRVALLDTPAFQALRTGRSTEATLGFYRPDGDLVWLAVQAEPLFLNLQRSPDAAVVTFSVVTFPIAHRPASGDRLSGELEQCLTELQTLLDAAPVGIAIATDPACRVLRLNAHLQQMLGLNVNANASQHGIPAAEVPFRAFQNNQEISASDLPMAMACQQNVTIRDIELQLVRSNGEAIDLLSSATPLRDPQGNVWGCIGVYVDITTRKRLEAQLQASEAQVRLATTAANLGLWCWQPDRKQLELSDECKTLFGFAQAEDVSHRQVIDRLHPDDRLRVEAALAQAIADGGEYDIEYRLLWPNGSIRWIAAKGRSFARGSARQVIGTAQDITRQKVAAQEREQLLRREQEARRQAETASRTKDEFLAIVSHELRSPLNAILGWAKLLRSRSYDSATIDRALEVIDRNAQAQSQLIDDLLDVSRIIRGKIKLQHYPVNLTNLLTAAIDAIHPAADSKQIQIATDLADAVESVGDRDRLQQVITNLLSNAIKFTPNGGRVTVRLVAAGNFATPTARLTISDTGIGIHPDFLPFVFDRFRQAQHSTTKAQSGLGLGLAIVRNLVELHGGTVEVTSAGEGQGTTFSVELPIVRSMHQPHRIAPARRNPQSAIDLSILNGLKILVVDDEMDSRDMLVAALEQYGANLAAAASVDEALHLLTSLQPDVIISDIAMPDADGYALMRSIQSTTQIPVVAVTALAKAEDRQKVLAAGFVQHLAKPIDPVQLAQAIAQVVRKDF